MSGYLLDTDRIADYLNERPDAVALVESLASQGIAISIITYAELYRGIHFSRDRNTAVEKFANLLLSVPVLPIGRGIAERWAILKGTISIPPNRNIDFDLFIGATALTTTWSLSPEICATTNSSQASGSINPFDSIGLR